MSGARRVEVEGRDTVQWILQAAVLVYQNKAGQAYATVHGIESGGKPLRLAAGRPATKEACADLARSLGAMAGLTGFTPSSLLYLGARTLIWWRPPAPARVFFSPPPPDTKDRPKGSAVTPQPGLVFALAGTEWYVYALGSDARPGPATKLCRAPYYNVYENGHICTGNVRLPETLSPTSLDEYERAFFDSNFTHPNMPRLVKGKSGAAFWCEGLAGKWGKRFPVRALLPEKLTLDGLAKRLDQPEKAPHD